MTKCRTHSLEFKARVAMEAISGRKTLQEIAAYHAIHPIQVSQWKQQLLEGAADLFSKGRKGKEKGVQQTSVVSRKSVALLPRDVEVLIQRSGALQSAGI